MGQHYRIFVGNELISQFLLENTVLVTCSCFHLIHVAKEIEITKMDLNVCGYSK